MTREEIVDSLEFYTAGRPLKSQVSITVQELQSFINEIKALEQDTNKEKEIDGLFESLQKANATNAKLIELLENMKKSSKKLRKESCEDAVSRREVLDELRTCFDTHSIYDENNGENYIIYEDAVDMMEKLPSVTPTISEIDKFNDSVNRATVLSLISDVQNADGFKDYSQYEYLFDQVDKMPMATPTRKVGKWIEIKNKNGKVIALRCNCCEKSPKHAIRSLWCPNCGADMRGSEDGSN